ncbi:MAG TPA: hypothetical protein EYP06_00055 [Desulfobacterales bacterium]|nr:hypothetical protein [Desulfobacterales bacterium]
MGKAFIWHKEMAKLKFIVVGKTKAPFLRQGEEFYLHKIRHYVNAEWIEVRAPQVNITAAVSPSEVAQPRISASRILPFW